MAMIKVTDILGDYEPRPGRYAPRAIDLDLKRGDCLVWIHDLADIETQTEALDPNDVGLDDCEIDNLDRALRKRGLKFVTCQYGLAVVGINEDNNCDPYIAD